MKIVRGVHSTFDTLSSGSDLKFNLFSILIPALDSSVVYTPVVVSSVTVPQYGVHGKHAVLYCSYRSVQPVYSVRWYKNGKEFFR